MSNIEFISAKDLPTTESNEVDVLCVENGELKLKAGASLGGGKPFVLRFEDAYFSDGDVIFVDPELFAEVEKQINGESVCSVIYNYEGENGLTSENGCYCMMSSFGDITVVGIGTINAFLTVCKTAEDADAFIASMNQGA